MLSPRREVGEFRKRYKWMALAVFVAFATLAARVFVLQVVKHDHFAEIARENITKTIPLPATRGLVFDTAGRVVAENRPAYNVLITPSLLDPPRDLPRLAELMGLTPAQRDDLARRIAEVPARRRTHQIEMFSEITREQLAALETHANELPGVDAVAVPVRSYPYGTLGAHAIGYLNEVSAEDLEGLREQGYRAGDVVGRTGIEHAWESYLRGQRGYQRVLVDVRGRHQEEAPGAASSTSPSETRREPVPGRDLTLTLDMELMRSVERAFRGHPSGAAVVVDVRTGRVRALFSKPSYDLSEMAGRLSSERYAEMQENPFRPLIDKTIYESYFPGSTFKPITALAGLGDGIIDPAATIECPGFYEIGNRRFRCSQPHGSVDMRRALVQSCNVYFWRIAEQIGLDRINNYSRYFGLGQRSGIGINTEANGFLASRAWYESQHERFRVGFTLNTAIGQGNTRVTLLQLAMVYASIANGGTLYVPQLVQSVHEPDGTIVEEFGPRVRRRVQIAPEHLTYVIDGLYGVVNDSNGTAYDARIEGGVPVAGKTGTAQVQRRSRRPGEDQRRSWYFNRDHAWFAGFAPAGDPEVAIVVLVEHGGGGGRYAAPIATQILQDYLGDEVPAPLAQTTRAHRAAEATR